MTETSDEEAAGPELTAVAPEAGGPVAGPARSGRGSARARRLAGRRNTPLWLLGVVSIVSLATRLYRLNFPNTLVFDENTYVNAARVILGLKVPAGAPLGKHLVVGQDPAWWHPPLVKVLIASSMSVFGNNGWGWRLPAVLFGSVALLAMYWLVRAAKGSPWLALGATTLMAFDNLFFVHARVGMLEIFQLAFMLIALALYLRKEYIFAGVVLGIGACCKINALLLVPIVISIELVRWATAKRAGGGAPEGAVSRMAMFTGVSLASFVVFLELLDLRFSKFRDPFSHIYHMVVSVGSVRFIPLSQTGSGTFNSNPWDWLLNNGVLNYWTVYRNVYKHGVFITSVDTFRMLSSVNPFILFLAIPSVALAIYCAWKDGDEVAIVAASWTVVTFGFFLFVDALGRTSYEYYMLTVMPGIYLSVARLFSRRYLPRAAVVGYGLGVALGFWGLFPFRRF